MLWLALVLLLLFPLTQAEEQSTFSIMHGLEQFFGSAMRSSRDVRWAHAVNSRAKLIQVLDNDQIMMIEADICEDPHAPSVAIMAHPPDFVSDITFTEWIDEVLRRYNEQGRKVGVKLDFKHPTIVRSCISYLNQKGPIELPVWLNADIVQGPGGFVPVFDPDDFLRACAEYPSGVVSLGWTTRRSIEPNSEYSQGYSTKHVDELISVCKRHSEVTQLTFAVRAELLQRSWGEIQRLLTELSPETTLTIWSGPEKASTQDLAWILKHLPENRYFLDVVVREDRPSAHKAVGMFALFSLAAFVARRIYQTWR